MGIEIPPSLQWVSYLAGTEWPQGDETGMFRIRDAWHASADDLVDLIPDLNRVRAQVLSVLTGETAKAADEQFALLFDGEYSIGMLEEAMSALGDLAGQGGTEIEYTKLQIIATLAVAAAELQFALASAVGTGGKSLTAIPVIETVAAAAIRQLVVMLMRRIASAVAGALAKTAVKRLAGRGAHELALGLAIEAGIQGHQVNAGHRERLVAGMLRDVAIISALGGAVQRLTSTVLTDAFGRSRNLALAAAKGAAANGVATPAGTVVGTVAVGAPLDPMSLLASGSHSGVKGAVRSVGWHRTTPAATDDHPRPATGDNAPRPGWRARADNLSDLRSGRPGGSEPAKGPSHRPGNPEAATPRIEIAHPSADTAPRRTAAVPIDSDAARLGARGSASAEAGATVGESTAAPTDSSARAAAPVISSGSGPALSPGHADAATSPETASGGGASPPPPSPSATAADIPAHPSAVGPAVEGDTAQPHVPPSVGNSAGNQSLGGPAADEPGQHPTGMLGTTGALRARDTRRRADAEDNDIPGRQPVPVDPRGWDRCCIPSSAREHANCPPPQRYQRRAAAQRDRDTLDPGFGGPEPFLPGKRFMARISLGSTVKRSAGLDTRTLRSPQTPSAAGDCSAAGGCEATSARSP